MRQLEALETGRYEILPAKVFTRGFVRAIALHLGLDPEAYTAAFSSVWDSWTAEEMSRTAVELVQSGQHVRLSKPRRAASVSMVFVGVGIALVIALVTFGAAILKGRGDRSSQRSASRQRFERAPVPESGPASLALPPAIAASTVALPHDGPAAPVAPEGKAAEPSALNQVAGRQVAGQPGLTLALTFRNDCWTEVSVDGKQVAAELFRKGDVKQFSGADRFVLTLGDAGAVAVTLNGKPVTVGASAGRVVKNLVLDQSASRPHPANG